MKLFVDMDGVLTDFDLKASELLDVPRDDVQDYIKEHSKRSWFKIDRAGENFWKNMKWMPDGKELWKNVEIYRPTILTAPTRHPSSFEGKKKWLGNEIGEVPYIIDSDKSKYAENKSFILIDDREKNIDAWKKAGGTGILHKSTIETLDKLQEILSNIKYAYQKDRVCMNKIVNYLDRIASNLEDKGLLKKAEEIDIISNTLDKIAAEKWIQKADPEEGKFDEWCKRHGFERGVCQSCINKAAEEGGEAARMANFAVNVSKSKYHYPKKKDASNYSSIEAGKKPKGEKGDAKERSRPNPVFDHTDPKVLDNADHFPINDATHARNALARANQYSESPDWFDGSLKELKKKVADAVKAAYPTINVTKESYD